MQFKLVEHVSITPSKCVFCGAVEGPFLVTLEETWIEGYGLVAICASNTEDRAGCLVQAAREAGSVDAPVHEKALSQRDYWKGVFEEASLELGPLRELSDAVAKIHGSRDGGEDAADASGNEPDEDGAPDGDGAAVGVDRPGREVPAGRDGSERRR